MRRDEGIEELLLKDRSGLPDEMSRIVHLMFWEGAVDDMALDITRWVRCRFPDYQNPVLDSVEDNKDRAGDPDRLMTAFRLSMLLEEMGALARALQQNINRLVQDSDRSLWNAAAIELLEKMVCLEDRNVDAHVMLGNAYRIRSGFMKTEGLRQTSLTMAINHLQTAAGMDERNYEAWFGLGVSFHRSGNWSKACDCFIKASGIRPDDPSPNMFMGRMATEVDPEKKEQARKAGRSLPLDDVSALFHLDLAFAKAKKQGNSGMAFFAYTQARKIRFNPLLDDEDNNFSDGESNLPPSYYYIFSLN